MIFGTAVLAVALLVTLAVLSNIPKPVAVSAPSPAAEAEIEINHFAFTPAIITIPVGTQVTWTNKDEITHNVVSADKTIKSKALDTNEKFTFTFTQAGTFSYVCTIHRVKGTVVVQ
jgi:plastocyanin